MDPNFNINGVNLEITKAVRNGAGDNGSFIYEKIGSSLDAVNDPFVDGDLGNLSTEFSWLDGPGGTTDLSSTTTFSAQHEIFVSKNISVWADTAGSGFNSITAKLNIFEQRFSQINAPTAVSEPGILLLLAAGFMGFLFNQKRRKFFLWH